MTCPIPIILSLVLKIGARDMLEQEKHMLSKIMTMKTPTILRGLRMMLILRIKASMTTATAWNRPLTPADRAFPKTMDDRGTELK